MRRRSSSVREVEDVVELMQLIQSWLPVEEAARTSVLSKSWLHAWSTIPTLRFLVRETKHLNLVDRTLNRYLRDNIPIERFDLDIRIDNPKSASLAEKWIRSVATATTTTKTSCPLKELNLRFQLFGASITLPVEILTVATNLTKLKVSSSRGTHSVWMKTPIINCNCVSLRQVFLRNVRISQEVLDDILLSCSLLAKLDLILCCSLKSIKVINRPCLNELRINLNLGEKVDNPTALEISHVPNLRVFGCQLPPPSKLCCSSSLGSSVTELLLGGGALITDESSLDMIKSGLFPFLESLTLDMDHWTPGSFHFTCATLKRLSLRRCRRSFIDVQVYAPKLLFFLFGNGGFTNTMPSLLFPVSTLNQTTFWLRLDVPLLDASFFLKMREALALSTKCDLSITTSKNYKPPSHAIDIIDDLRTRLPPAPNNVVQLLEFQTINNECIWERSPFLDAFFEVCHPNQVIAKPDAHFRPTNHLCKLMLSELLEKKNNNKATAYWSRDLKHVQIRHHGKWETLTNSHTSFLDEPPPGDVHFRLNWR